MGSGASSTTTARSQQRQQQQHQQHQLRLQQHSRSESRSAPEQRRGGGGGGEAHRRTYWCHQCQVSVSRLGEGSVCPLCHGGFIQESTSVVMLAQAARWLASSGGQEVDSTEARIARLLDDLHAHLEMVEGLHESMRNAMDQAEESGRPQLDPAPQQVLDAIEALELDANTLTSMRQTAQCVICCADFEVGERLSRLPGCGHLFHDTCVMQWLERASNCPICRCDLCEAVGATSRSDVAGEASLEEASESLQELQATMAATAPSFPSLPSNSTALSSTAPHGFAEFPEGHPCGPMGQRRLAGGPGGSSAAGQQRASGSSSSGTAPASLQSAAAAAAVAAAAASSALAAAAVAADAATSSSPHGRSAAAGGARGIGPGGGGRPASSVLVGAGGLSIAPGTSVSGPESPCSTGQARSGGSSGLRW